MHRENAKLFAITPQIPKHNQQLIEKLHLNFEILHDAENLFAEQLDLVHGFDDDLKQLYLGFGADLAAFNGDAGWRLPIPTRIVVGSDHHVKSIQYDADYKVRPEPDETLQQVRNIQS